MYSAWVYLFFVFVFLAPSLLFQHTKSVPQKENKHHVMNDVRLHISKMAAGPNWASLPSILIVDILSYLSHEDRLKASSSCKRWRNCLFHPIFWQKIRLLTGNSDRQRTKFLTDRCGRFVREVCIVFNSHNYKEVRECYQILDVLCGNKNLTVFSLQPSSCHFEWPEIQSTYFIDR